MQMDVVSIGEILNLFIDVYRATKTPKIEHFVTLANIYILVIN